MRDVIVRHTLICAEDQNSAVGTSPVTPARPHHTLCAPDGPDISGYLNAAHFACGNQLWVALMLGVNHNLCEGCHCPTGAGVGQSSYAGVVDLVVTERKLLQRARMAHHTRLSGMENACAKSQGVGSRQ